MFGFDETTKARTRAFQHETTTAAEDWARCARGMLSGTEPLDIGTLLRAYVHGVGSFTDTTRYRLRQLTDEVGQKCGILAAGDSFFGTNWGVRRTWVATCCPDVLHLLYEGRDNAGLETTTLLEPCPNEAIYLQLPPPLGSLIRKPWRPPLRLYGTDDAVVYAHPLQYQVLSKDRQATWNSASPRGLTRGSVPDLAEETIDRNIVVVQDRFIFSNLCHFLYDGVTRIAHYLARSDTSGSDLFVMGSIPAEYHALVLGALCEQSGLSADSFLFPTRSMILATKRRCFWFSDQFEGHAHPAQMAHPASIAALRRISSGIRVPAGSARRLYISRADADRRRVTNEADLMTALRDRGFVEVRLGELSGREQIGLFRDAETVVGPHGMGLTHIVMGQRLEAVVELFHPDAGTDAYAFVARAAGMRYNFVIGSAIPNTQADFAVDVDQVLHMLDEARDGKIGR